MVAMVRVAVLPAPIAVGARVWLAPAGRPETVRAAVPLNPGVIDTDMLRSSWGEGAAGNPKPEQWAKTAAPFILKLSAKDNGRSLSVGAHED